MSSPRCTQEGGVIASLYPGQAGRSMVCTQDRQEGGRCVPREVSTRLCTQGGVNEAMYPGWVGGRAGYVPRVGRREGGLYTQGVPREGV